jgi:hypothetical protein
MPGVGDADVEDRFGVPGEVGPDAQRREQALAGVGDGGGAAVVRGLDQGVEHYPVDQRGGESCLARGERQQAAVQAGTHDDEIGRLVPHGP